MEKKYNNMDKIESTKVIEIIKDYKSRPNKDLILVLEFVKKDYELTKENLIKLTEHLDKLEITYNTILKEYESRNVVSK
jgi:hypothetical protein